jgi:Kdo2-lipid IVA lauroyltransferase/acyltransferase
MEAAIFYLFYVFNWIITLLPLPVLYLFSDFLFLILYYFPSYRRKIVADNLKNSFPEKSEKELRSIEKKFYRHLADLFVEVLKLSHMSEPELARRYKIFNTELLDRLLAEKRDIAGICGHYNNWEWMIVLPCFTKYKVVTIYKPLQNKHFDRFMNKMRSRYGMVLTPMSSIIRDIIADRKNGINTISGFITDQIPAKGDITYWTRFLNQDTAVFTGVEKIAMKYDMAVLYYNIRKIKRGYYNVYIEPLFEHTSGLPEHAITESHVRRLEETIREKPEYWLWSHRRWKHKKPADNV